MCCNRCTAVVPLKSAAAFAGNKVHAHWACPARQPFQRLPTSPAPTKFVQPTPGAPEIVTVDYDTMTWKVYADIRAPAADGGAGEPGRESIWLGCELAAAGLWCLALQAIEL